MAIMVQSSAGEWGFIRHFLYLEISLAVVMLGPIISPRRLNQLSKLSLFQGRYAAVYFSVLLGVLFLLLLDSIREMRTYFFQELRVNLTSGITDDVEFSEARKNFYMTTSAIFLACVLRKLVCLLIIQDELTIKVANATKEAESTVQHIKNKENNKKINELENDLETTEELLKEFRDLEVKELEEEATKWRLKFEEVSLRLNTGKGDN